MGKPEVVAGLDMGSGRVTCAVGTLDPATGSVDVLAGSSVPCRGLQGGVVINIAEARRAVGQAVEEAEAASGRDIYGVYMGVRGEHLHSFNNRGKYTIARTDRQITHEDISAVLQNARAVPVANDKDFLHVIPQGYTLDGKRGVPNPEGMEAFLLEVDVHVVTASVSHLNNLYKAVTQAGFEVVEPVYSLLAAGELLLTPEEREIGALFVDFGGQSISLGIYHDGAVKFSKDLPVGSDHITRDLAVGLRTSYATAERIKVEHGLAHPKLLNGDGEIKYPGVDGRITHSVSTSSMLEFILPRVEEIFDHVSGEIEASGFADLAVPGAVLTGGGALLKGMKEAAEQVLSRDVRMGIPHQHPMLASCPEQLLQPRFATALGLLVYRSGSAWGARGPETGRKPAWMRRVKSLLQELF